MADTSVKFFHSGMIGSPQLSGQAGALIGVLDACLVNGFGLKSVDSLVVTDDVAEMTISTGHGAEVGAVVLVAGATPSSLNGEQKVISTTSTEVRFATSGIANQTATGTITMKLAGGGWTKPFSGTNKAAYKSSSVQATGCYLQVEDNGTTSARLVGYETMLDVDSGTGPFPTTAQRTGGTWWSKSDAADATAKDWMLITDGRVFYMGRQHRAANAPGYELTMFGDLLPCKSGDPFACALNGRSADSSTSPLDVNNLWQGDALTAHEMYCPRAYTGLGGSMQMRKSFAMVMANTTSFTSGKGVMPYPNPSDGGVYLQPMYATDTASTALRGLIPGFYGSPQYIPNNTFAARDSITGTTNLPGRILKYIPGPFDSASSGGSFVDITGPWR
jgi:hypothetical protein